MNGFVDRILWWMDYFSEPLYDPEPSAVVESSKLAPDRDEVMITMTRETWAPGVWAGSEGSSIVVKDKVLGIKWVDLENRRIVCNGFIHSIEGCDIYIL